MFAVGYGYNALFVTMGVFETREKADETLKEMGAKWIERHDDTLPWNHKTVHVSPHWEITKEFLGSLEKMQISMYSVAGDIVGDWLIIAEFEINKFQFSYNDD